MPQIFPLSMKYVQKPWGYEMWIFNGDKYCGKKLFIKQGHWLSYHHHNVKDEVLFVESGRIWFTHNENGGHVSSIELSEGHAFHVAPGVKHQMQGIVDTVIFEFSTHHEDSDSIRTTRDLMVDHGDNGFPIRTYTEPPSTVQVVIPPMNVPFIRPDINFANPKVEKNEVSFEDKKIPHISNVPSWDKNEFDL